VLGIVAVLGGIVVLAIFLVSRFPGSGASLGGGSGPRKAEAVDVRSFRDRAGRLFFIGELANTGSTEIGPLTAKLTLLDGNRKQVGSSACASVVRVLAPGQRVPCTFAISGSPSFATFQIAIESGPPPGSVEPAVLLVSSSNLARTGFPPVHQVSGTIKNMSSFPARQVMALVSLYGSDGKIVGFGLAQVPGGQIAPGATASFSTSIGEVAAPAAKVVARAVGYR
jgi:hypothetical protein